MDEKEELKKEIMNEINKKIKKQDETMTDIIKGLTQMVNDDMSELEKRQDELTEFINRLKAGVTANARVTYEMFEILRTKGILEGERVVELLEVLKKLLPSKEAKEEE